LTWVCRLHTIPEEKLEALLQYCWEAELKDSTFKHVEEGENGKIKYIIITCVSKDQAFRRGSLFHHRFGVFYEVEWKKS